MFGARGEGGVPEEEEEEEEEEKKEKVKTKVKTKETKEKKGSSECSAPHRRRLTGSMRTLTTVEAVVMAT